MVRLKAIPAVYGHNFDKFARQNFTGNITIVPKVPLSLRFKLLSHPTEEDMVQYIEIGEKASWPHLEHIGHVLLIEKLIDRSIADLKLRQSMLAMGGRMTNDPPLIPGLHIMQSLPRGVSIQSNPSTRSQGGGGEASSEHSLHVRGDDEIASAKSSSLGNEEDDLASEGIIPGKVSFDDKGSGKGEGTETETETESVEKDSEKEKEKEKVVASRESTKVFSIVEKTGGTPEVELEVKELRRKKSMEFLTTDDTQESDVVPLTTLGETPVSFELPINDSSGGKAKMKLGVGYDSSFNLQELGPVGKKRDS